MEHRTRVVPRVDGIINYRYQVQAKMQGSKRALLIVPIND